MRDQKLILVLLQNGYTKEVSIIKENVKKAFINIIFYTKISHVFHPFHSRQLILITAETRGYKDGSPSSRLLLPTHNLWDEIDTVALQVS